MSDLIDRQAAIKATWEEPMYADPINVLTEVRDRIKALPSAERRGRWLFNSPYMCDQCGEWAEKEFKFCPSCGAKMKEGGE